MRSSLCHLNPVDDVHTPFCCHGCGKEAAAAGWSEGTPPESWKGLHPSLDAKTVSISEQQLYIITTVTTHEFACAGLTQRADPVHDLDATGRRSGETIDLTAPAQLHTSISSATIIRTAKTHVVRDENDVLFLQGTAFLVHPQMLHTSSQNMKRLPRFMRNWQIPLSEPRPFIEGRLSPVERCILVRTACLVATMVATS